MAQGTADISYVAFLLITRDAVQLITQLDFTVQKRKPRSGFPVLSHLTAGTGLAGRVKLGALSLSLAKGCLRSTPAAPSPSPFASTAHSDFPRVWIRSHASLREVFASRS